MGVQQVSLEDRFDLSKSQVLLTGTQAPVRLMLRGSLSCPSTVCGPSLPSICGTMLPRKVAQKRP